MTAPAPLSRAQVREVDRIATDDFHIPSIVLMENAGLLSALEIQRERGPGGAPVHVVAGGGNNGGDGYVVARQLALRGVPVVVWSTRATDELRGDARVQREIVDAMQLPAHDLRGPGALERARAEWPRPGLLVDALLGTGFEGALRPGLAEVVEALNGARAAGGARVVALDLPSGLDADLGTPAPGGEAVRADLTLTFVARKTGFDVPGAERWTGEVRVLPIGAPDEAARRARAGR